MQTLGRLPMQSSDGRDLCQKGLTVTSALVFSPPSIYGRRRRSTTVNYLNNFFLGIRKGSVNSAPELSWQLLIGFCCVGLLRGDPESGCGQGFGGDEDNMGHMTQSGE
jgi:hypothetical protein